MLHVLTFFGYDDTKEEAANLLILAGLHSPLIESLSSL